MSLSSPSPQNVHMAELVAQGEDERIKRYERAWKAYDGEGPQPLVIAAGEPNDNIRLDYAKLIVRKGVSFLVGKGDGVTFQADEGPEVEAAPAIFDEEPDPEAPDPEETAEDEAIAALDAAWPPEQRAVDFHNLATNGGVCGDAWLRLYEDGRVSVLDPANVSATWSEDDISVIEQYVIQWNTVDRETGMGVVRRKRIEPDNPVKPTRWTIYDEEHDDQANVWNLMEETPWAHDFAPLIGAQNLPSPNTFYGEPDLSPAILDMIEQLEFAASDMRRILRLQGHPVPVIFGIEAHKLQALDLAVGEILAIAEKDGSLGQLAIAELTSALEYFRELKTALFEAAEIPKVALGDTANAGPTTGVALKVEYEPLIEKTDTKRNTYGLLLVEAASRILALKNKPGWRFTLGWPDMLPTDTADEAVADESEIRMGIVSKQTIAEKRGYDWAIEQERMAEETPSFDAGGPPGPPYDQPPTLVPVPAE